MKHLNEITKELIALEPIFHRGEVASTREDFEKIIDKDFIEVGASGKKYFREEVIDTLVKRRVNANSENWQTKDFSCIKLSDNTFLLIYTLIQGDRISYRSTVWRNSENNWRVVYHQGTLFENGG